MTEARQSRIAPALEGNKNARPSKPFRVSDSITWGLGHNSMSVGQCKMPFPHDLTLRVVFFPQVWQVCFPQVWQV